MRMFIVALLCALSYAQTGCEWEQVSSGFRCSGTTINSDVNTPEECADAAEALDKHFFTYRSDRSPPHCRVPDGANDAEDTTNCLTSPASPNSGSWSIYQQICPSPTLDPTNDPTYEPSLHPSYHPSREPTDFEDAPCKSWCRNPRDEFTKDQYCAFDGCRGCDECWMPTQEPTAPIPGCASWCHTNTKPWDEKCPHFLDCRQCTECAEPLCSPWCFTHTRKWRAKCQYLHCSACKRCSKFT